MGLFFGKVVEGKMEYSVKGKIVFKNIMNMPKKFLEIKLIDFVVMPNHIHILLKMLRKNDNKKVIGYSRDVINHVSTMKNSKTFEMGKKCPMKCFGLGTVIRWFKAKSSTEIRKKNLFFAWQSRYFDEIIWDENRYWEVKNYIKNNPVNWEKDKFCKNK